MNPAFNKTLPEDIVKAIKDAVLVKEPGHKINLDDFEQPQRAMHAIGG